MEMYVKIDFNGSYRAFYPEIDLEQKDKVVVIAVVKKFFGDKTKVYFTDDQEASLLEDKSTKQSTETNITSSGEISLTDEEKFLIARNKEIIAAKQKKPTDAIIASNKVDIKRNEGRAPGW